MTAAQIEHAAHLSGVAASPIVITAYGTPQGQGNLKTGRHGKSYHANDTALRAWRTLVRTAAILALDHPEALDGDHMPGPAYPWTPHPDGPVGIDVVITVPAVKAKRQWPHTRSTSDADHYLRAIGDALTGVAYTDDAQICDARIRVTYPGRNGGLDRPGAHIRLWPLEADS